MVAWLYNSIDSWLGFEPRPAAWKAAMQTNRPFPLYEWNFDLDMPGQKFHHSLKKHHKISNIPKFRCEML
jgi:hypothetical protein